MDRWTECENWWTEEEEVAVRRWGLKSLSYGAVWSRSV